MVIYSWDLDGGFSTPPLVSTPRLTIRCEYPDTDMPPTDVTFGLSPSYGLHTARDAHEWFLDQMREHDEFEVETHRAGELPMPFLERDGAAGGGGVEAFPTYSALACYVLRRINSEPV